MSPMELQVRRKALGLSQKEFALAMVAVDPYPDGTPRKPPKQSALANWETREVPDAVDAKISHIFELLDIVMHTMEEDITSMVEAVLDDKDADDLPDILSVPAYYQDEDFWAEYPQYEGYPAGMWNVAAVHVADSIMAKHSSILVELLPVGDKNKHRH